jgi:hypothetical protein
MPQHCQFEWLSLFGGSNASPYKGGGLVAHGGVKSRPQAIKEHEGLTVPNSCIEATIRLTRIASSLVILAGHQGRDRAKMMVHRSPEWFVVGLIIMLGCGKCSIADSQKISSLSQMSGRLGKRFATLRQLECNKSA